MLVWIGGLKAYRGAHEVITTIMLNWIAIWGGVWLFGLGGPLQDPHQSSVPTSSPVAASAKLPVFWGNASLQGLDIGLFIALGLVVVFWVMLNRTRFGYEVRAVGLNSDAASYAGISVARSYFRVMAICGAFSIETAICKARSLRQNRRPNNIPCFAAILTRVTPMAAWPT